MANLLIVGADHLGNITKKLKMHGFNNVMHISGRKVNMVKREIPEGIDAVFVITDFINHNLAKVIKQKAKEQSVPTYYVKRSWCSIMKVLEEGHYIKNVG